VIVSSSTFTDYVVVTTSYSSMSYPYLHATSPVVPCEHSFGNSFCVIAYCIALLDSRPDSEILSTSSPGPLNNPPHADSCRKTWNEQIFGTLPEARLCATTGSINHYARDRLCASAYDRPRAHLPSFSAKASCLARGFDGSGSIWEMEGPVVLSAYCAAPLY